MNSLTVIFCDYETRFKKKTFNNYLNYIKNQSYQKNTNNKININKINKKN